MNEVKRKKLKGKSLILTFAFCLLSFALLWAATATDNFNRADGGLGANWTVITGVTEVVSTRAEGIGSQYYNAITPGGNQYSQFTIDAFTASGPSQYLWASVRDSGTGSDYYRGGAARNDGYFGGVTSFISVTVGGSETVIASEAATTWVATDTVRLSVTGSSFTLLRNGSTLLTQSDATFTTGYVGFGIYTEGNSGDTTLDNWTGGDVATTAVARRRGPIQQ